jgi:hypothetical protein
LRQGNGSIRLGKKLIESDGFEKPMLLHWGDESRSAGGILPQQDHVPVSQCPDKLCVDSLAFGLHTGVGEHDGDCNI